MDANFRLSRKSVSSEKKDPALFDGKAYFVEEKAYKEHLAKHSDLPQEVGASCLTHLRSFELIFFLPFSPVRAPLTMR